MFGKLKALIGGSRTNQDRHWNHVSTGEWPAAVYAIGDVHGCLQQLKLLEQRIIADAAAIEGDKWLLYLGDYVDRGPDSAGVIDHLMRKAPPGFRRLCLAGNHELMALSFFRSPSRHADWLDFGGMETLASYGISSLDLQRTPTRGLEGLIRSHVPEDHLQFLEHLLLTVSLPGHIFVHAGLRPGIALASQHEQDLLWIRDEFFDGPLPPGTRIVHGHTPDTEVFVSPGRICVDTGAFATGILSAVRLQQNGALAVLDTTDAQDASA